MDKLIEAYRNSSQGKWVSKRCTFTAKDRDFANLAHNNMPMLIEAVRLLQVVISKKPYLTNEPFNRGDYESALAVLEGLKCLIKFGRIRDAKQLQ